MPKPKQLPSLGDCCGKAAVAKGGTRIDVVADLGLRPRLSEYAPLGLRTEPACADTHRACNFSSWDTEATGGAEATRGAEATGGA